MFRQTSLRFLSSPVSLLFFLVSLVLWIFVWVHAFQMDMTHDEAYSYRMIKTNYLRALVGSANNHWLNSIFMEIFNMIFGDEPGYLRLGSVLAFPFYAWGIYRLGQLTGSLPVQLFFYALTLLNPYIVDWFSLARGYGLAMTFEVWSLVFFVKAAHSGGRFRNWLPVILMNALTVAANFSFFYAILGMAGYYAFFVLAPKVWARQLDKETRKTASWYAVVVFGTIADLVFLQYYSNDLYFGEASDLVNSMFASVWWASLYGAAYQWLLPLLTNISFYGSLLASAYYCTRFIRTRKITAGFLISLPLLSILAFSIVFHLVFNSPYLNLRTALPWYLPGILLLCLAAHECGSRLRPARWLQGVGTGIGMVMCALAGWHFYNRTSPLWSFEWPLQVNSRQAVDDLYALAPQQPAVGFAIGGVYKNYYILHKGPLAPLVEDLPDQYTLRTDTALRRRLLNSDYVITSYPVTIECLQDLGLQYEVLKTYPPGGNQLIRIHRK